MTFVMVAIPPGLFMFVQVRAWTSTVVLTGKWGRCDDDVVVVVVVVVVMVVWG